MHERSKFDKLYRGQQGLLVREADSSGGDATIADMFRGQVQAVIAPGAAANTYRVFTIKTTPAPVALPSGSPALPATIYVADVLNRGADIVADDWIFGVRHVGADTYNPGGGAVPVDWEYMPTAVGENKIFLVAVDKKSLSQGPGDWIRPARPEHRYFSGSLGTTPDVGDIWLLSNDHHHDPVDTGGTENVDWPHLPAHAVFMGYNTAATWDLATAQAEDYGSPPAWNDTEANYGTGEGEIDTVTHTGFYWTAVSPDIPVDSEPTDASIYWNKGEEIEDADERPVYRVEPVPPGYIPGYVTESVSAATEQGGASPGMSTATVRCYLKDEGGAWVHGPLVSGVQYNFEESIEPGTVAGMLGGVYGFWLLPGCSIGSSYVPPE